MAGYADMEVKESAEELLHDLLHPTQWLWPVDTIPSEEAFGKPKALARVDVPVRKRRKRRGLRPSERSYLSRYCPRYGTSMTGPNAPIYAGSDSCCWCEHMLHKAEED